MEFSVIYEFDVPRDRSVKAGMPTQRKLFDTTESGESDVFNKGKHRKMCALLDKPQFVRFLNDTGLCFEDVTTMGSLGAPGLGYGLSPAFAFRDSGCDQEFYACAYVTPLPKAVRCKSPEEFDKQWDRLRRAFKSMWG